MTLKKRLTGLILSTLVLLAGCVTAGRDFPMERTTEIVPGRSTKADVRRILGKPQAVDVRPDGEAWTYGYLFSTALGHVERKSYHVSFDNDGVVSPDQPQRPRR